tara:strand:- start:220 stop:618 length:399 start_codon:yes stop_codon:yes gene_type:complete
VSVDKKSVTFSLKNYRNEGRSELLTLKTTEFIRRFSLHILPKAFVRIRHFGFLSSTGKRIHLKELHNQLGKPKVKEKISKHLLCPKCTCVERSRDKQGKLVIQYMFTGRAPPGEWQAKLNQLKAMKNDAQKK